ncbi:hypothetical protein JCM13591A_18570 [Microbacterium xylanilyticum]
MSEYVSQDTLSIAATEAVGSGEGDAAVADGFTEGSACDRAVPTEQPETPMSTRAAPVVTRMREGILVRAAVMCSP